MIEGSEEVSSEGSRMEGASRFILHPLFISALTLWLFNDHALKRIHPSWLTGKLSDAAGLVAFPMMLAATFELLGLRVRRMLEGCALATALGFTAIQLSVPFATFYAHALGLAQWPAQALVACVEGRPLPHVGVVEHVMDPSDLLMLPVVVLLQGVFKR